MILVNIIFVLVGIAFVAGFYLFTKFVLTLFKSAFIPFWRFLNSDPDPYRGSNL